MKIRKARLQDAEGIAKVRVDSWRSTYKGIVNSQYLDNLDYESRTDRWRKILTDKKSNERILVAENDDKEIVGFSCGGPERERDDLYKGELYAIYILKEYQRHGLGRRLVAPLVEFLLANDIHSMLVWALADNESKKFYESLGGTFVKKRYLTIGSQSLVEHAYGWEEISQLNIVVHK